MPRQLFILIAAPLKLLHYSRRLCFYFEIHYIIIESIEIYLWMSELIL